MGAAESIALTKELFELTTFALEKGWLDRLLNLFRRRHRILVCGATGVGKTQLIRSLSKIVPNVISMLERTQFAERHRLQFDKQLFEFIDLPGDPLRAEIRRSEYMNCVRVGVEAVVNVVSYGYHEYRIGDAEGILNSTGSVSERYLKKHRSREIEILPEWTELLMEGDAQPAVITVCNKADIWWDKHETVRTHYEAGPYNAELSKRRVSTCVIDYSSRSQRPFGSGTVARSFDDTT